MVIILCIISQKFCDLFAGTLGFWLFGHAISGNTDAKVMGAEQDYGNIFWFFRVRIMNHWKLTMHMYRKCVFNTTVLSCTVNTYAIYNTVVHLPYK